MSDDKSKVTDKASEIAKNIWLAGVGAYGRAVDEAQGRLEKAGVETPKLFRDLVKAGTALEEEARDEDKSTTSTKHSVEDRINKVRENFNLQRPARVEDIAALDAKVDLLSRKIDLLAHALTEMGVAAPPKARAAATKKKRPPLAKKKPTATKKPTAKTKAPIKKKPAAGKKISASAAKIGKKSKS